jgi:hypothetical protein
MTQQVINTGTRANDGSGDPLRTAFIKCNNNFTEVYASLATVNGILRTILTGHFTFPIGQASTTVTVSGMPSTANFKFFPFAGNTEAWNAWRFIQITSQATSEFDNSCIVTLTLPSAPASLLYYHYEVVL